MTYSTAVVLFRGYIESIRPTPFTTGDRRVTIECVDGMVLLDTYEEAIAFQTNVHADDIISPVVSAVYTPPATNYEKGVNLFPFSGDKWSASEKQGLGFEDITAGQKIQDACVSDWGRFFISKAGNPTYFNRYHAPYVSAILHTLVNNMMGMGYVKRVSTVWNDVEVSVNPRSVGTVLEVLGRVYQSDPPQIEASASQTFTLYFVDPSNNGLSIGGKDAITPVAGTDYACTDDEAGEGNNLTGSVSVVMTAYADRADVMLTNSSSGPVYVQTLQVRGYAVRVLDAVTLTAEDAASQAANEKRKLTLNAALMSNQDDGQGLADYLISVYKNPLDEVTGLRVLANRGAVYMAAVRDAELMDKVVLTETQTGLSSYAGIIYAMTHEINYRDEHWLTLSLETAFNPGTRFQLDVSALNSGHLLIY
jgi:hypothetical protein